MPNQQDQPRQIKFGRVIYHSRDKGALIADISQKADEFFVSDEVIAQSFRDVGMRITKGQLVQFELEGDEVKTVKPL